MGRRRSQFSGFKRVSGAQAGRIAVKVRVCKNCDLHHDPGVKPKACMECGHLAFIIFDSIVESGRWATLRLLERRGKISSLRRQVSFDLMASRRVDGKLLAVKVVRYIADFTYTQDDEDIIEDAKGAITDVAIIKLKWMEAMGLPVKLTS